MRLSLGSKSRSQFSPDFDVLGCTLLGCISGKGILDSVRGVVAAAERNPDRFSAEDIIGGAIEVDTTASMLVETAPGDSSRSRREVRLDSGVALPRLYGRGHSLAAITCNSEDWETYWSGIPVNAG